MPRTIAHRIDVSRPAIHMCCVWLSISTSDIRPEYRCYKSATHTCCANHLSAKMLEVTTLRTAYTLPSAEYGGVVRKSCYLRDRKFIIRNPPTRLGSCRTR